MLSDGGMIILFFVGIFFIPIIVITLIFMVNKRNRKKKKETYTGKTKGRIIRIVDKGLDHPCIIHVQYHVNGSTYEIKETAKMKCTAIRIGKIPIGQRKTFVLGTIKEGDLLEIRYDELHPKKAIIYENDGIITG